MLKIVLIIFGSFACHITCNDIVTVPFVKAKFAESPHWDAGKQSLYYVDLFGEDYIIFRYDQNANQTFKARIENESQAAFIIPIQNEPNHYAVGLGRAVKVIQWDGNSTVAHVVRLVTEVEQNAIGSENRIHQGKADGYGRLYFGTYNHKLCGVENSSLNALYRYSKGNGTKRLLNNLHMASGMAWNERRQKFYFIQTCDYSIVEFDSSPDTGDISYNRTAYSFYNGCDSPTFAPIGMVIDAAGNLWVALYNTSSVVKINPWTSELLETVNLPTPILSNVAIGGPDSDTLFITTGTVANDIWTGAVVDDPLPSSAGLLIMVQKLNTIGYPGRQANV